MAGVFPASHLACLPSPASQVEGRLAGRQVYPLKLLQTISQHLYGHLGFSGNSV